MKFNDLTISRFTIHRIYGKKNAEGAIVEPYADPSAEFCNLDVDGKDILTTRIKSATDQRKRFFELEIKETGKDSFWDIAHPIIKSDKRTFLKLANKIADKAAVVHDRINIPDGLFLVMEAKAAAKDLLIVVKAEKSNAFSMRGTNMQLIKDIFLSSDKTLYKIGVLVRNDSKSVSVKTHKCYVYDDSFSPVKEDLAIYFYDKLLGLSSEKNGKLQTNRLYRSIKAFTEENIYNIGDRNDIIRYIDKDLSSNEKKTIHADDFRHLFPSDLHVSYDHLITSEYPNAIVKDISLLSDFQTKKIKLTVNAELLLKNGIVDKVEFGDIKDADFSKTLNTLIDTGVNHKYVFIPTYDQIVDKTKTNKTPPKKR